MRIAAVVACGLLVSAASASVTTQVSLLDEWHHRRRQDETTPNLALVSLGITMLYLALAGPDRFKKQG
jgi:hypothetical protein